MSTTNENITGIAGPWDPTAPLDERRRALEPVCNAEPFAEIVDNLEVGLSQESDGSVSTALLWQVCRHRGLEVERDGKVFLNGSDLNKTYQATISKSSSRMVRIALQKAIAAYTSEGSNSIDAVQADMLAIVFNAPTTFVNSGPMTEHNPGVLDTEGGQGERPQASLVEPTDLVVLVALEEEFTQFRDLVSDLQRDGTTSTAAITTSFRPDQCLPPIAWSLALSATWDMNVLGSSLTECSLAGILSPW